ncbi:MAG: hydroxymethylbilane synthase [Gemmatimonadetes bacterium]|nr:hydroxymethylbilane synthase [Gemmatimonadota bacterium]
MSSLKIGTRGSALALWQAERVRSRLAERGVTSELVVIRTSGDEGSRRPSNYIEGKGLFTKELEEALLDGRIDAAVHSAKDLGAILPAGLELAAFPEREDPRDALVARPRGGLKELRHGARVGTTSLRRIAALLSQRPDVEIAALRGNVPTRVKRVEQGEIDAALLAMAGLKRLGLAKGAVPLDPASFVPAPAQGALAIETRSDTAAQRAVSELDDLAIRVAVEAERSAMAELEGGCRVPLGVICLESAGVPTLHLRVYAPDGSRYLSAQGVVDPRNPRESGRRAARELLAAGAAELIRGPREDSPSPSGRGG